MTKHKKVLKALEYISQVVNVACLVALAGSIELGFDKLILMACVFAISVSVTVLIHHADNIIRHVVALGFCMFTALYSSTWRISRYGRAFSKMKYDNGGYIGLYLICLKLYDDYVRGVTRQIVTLQDTNREYIDFIKDTPADDTLKLDACKPVELPRYRETIYLRCVESTDTNKRKIMGYRKVTTV